MGHGRPSLYAYMPVMSECACCSARRVLQEELQVNAEKRHGQANVYLQLSAACCIILLTFHRGKLQMWA